MLALLVGRARQVIYTAAHSPRAVAPADLAARVPGATVAADVPAAVQQALADAGPDDLVCVTGSLYVVGEALAWWEAQV